MTALNPIPAIRLLHSAHCCQANLINRKSMPQEDAEVWSTQPINKQNEAMGRGMWNAEKETHQQLMQLYLEAEGDVEQGTDSGAAGGGQ